MNEDREYGTLLGEAVAVDTGEHRFHVPECLFEDVETWVHEFTEKSLTHPIWDILEPYTIYGFMFPVNGAPPCRFTIEHIMTSLHLKSGLVDKLISPDEFFDFIQNQLSEFKLNSDKDE